MRALVVWLCVHVVLSVSVPVFAQQGPVRLDGRLDERSYRDLAPIGTATERTDVWVVFDDEFLYVSARNWESTPRDLPQRRISPSCSGKTRRNTDYRRDTRCSTRRS